MRKGTGQYPEGWTKFAQQVKEEAGWKCIRCGHPHDPSTGHTLTVHHVTMAKDEPFDHWWAFLALCQRCHLLIQAKVIIERPWLYEHSTWFKPFAAGYYAFINGRSHDRIYVMAHLEELLKLAVRTGADD